MGIDVERIRADAEALTDAEQAALLDCFFGSRGWRLQKPSRTLARKGMTLSPGSVGLTAHGALVRFRLVHNSAQPDYGE